MAVHEQCLTAFRQFLSERGLKWTTQREAIARAFLESERHLSAEELFHKLRRESKAGVGLATVYRTLRLLCEANVAGEREFGRGRALFEHKLGHESHDHLICTSCGAIVEFQADGLQRQVANSAASRGFRATSHELMVFGICRRCRRGKASFEGE